MPAVKIPGAASIDAVAPARDPGVSASPEDFGSQIGSSMEHLGNAAVEIGVHLDRKRNAAAAAMAGPEAEAEFNLEATKARIAAGKAAPASGSAAQAGTDLDATLLPIRQKIVAEKRAKFGLDDRAIAHIDGHLTGVQGHAVIGAVTDANNNLVQGFAARHDETVQSIAANALATGDVDSALKQVDDSVAAMHGIVPENYIAAQSAKSKTYVVDAAIKGYQALNTKEGFDKAEELTKRFYGSTPVHTTTQSNAAMQFFQGRGYSKEQSAGIVGHLSHESNFNTSASGDQGTAFGIAQWRGERLAGLKTYAASHNKPITDFQTQLEYVDRELNNSESGSREKLLAAKTTKQATDAFLGFERPQGWNTGNPHGYENRLRQAQAAAGEIQIAGKPELPDADRALRFNSEIAQARTKTLATDSHDAQTDYNRQIIDANAGIGTLPSRAAIENDPRLVGDTRNTLLAAHDSAAGDMAAFQAALKKFEPGGGDFNQFDKTDVANVDRIFNTLGGDMHALQVVHDRTGMVPPSAALALRGAMVSSDPQKVEAALQLSSNLVSEKYPHTFENVNGGEQLKKDVDTFRHFVGLGFDSKEATRRVMEERTPEYKQKVTNRIKGEDVDAIVKKEIKPSDLQSAFDPSFGGFARNPTVGFEPEMRKRAMNDYEELFRKYYGETGDVDRAKDSAQKQLKVTWGVTEVNGSKVVMKWAPENARVYAGIENPSEGIAKQAIEQVKISTGAPSSLAAADASLKLTPQEKALYQRHFSNLTGPGGVNNPDGSRSTLYQTTVEHDGKFYTIPTVFDGKILWDKKASDPAAAAVERVKAIGWDNFPSYATEAEAEARYQKLHGFMEKDTGTFQKNPHAFGLNVKRSDIHLQELPSPVTGERYMRGVPPVYLLSYKDKNGHMQQVQGDFYADPNVMRNEQTARRAEASAKIQARTAEKGDAADAARLMSTPTGRLGPTDRARKEELSKTAPGTTFLDEAVKLPIIPVGDTIKSVVGTVANPGATRLGGKKK